MKRAVVAVISGLVLAGCGGDSEASQAEEEETFLVRGTFVLMDATYPPEPNTPCGGSGGYSDIQKGAEVVIRNAEGKKIALTNLAGGMQDENGICHFLFEKQRVPVDGDIYSVEVSGRGEVSFTRDQATDLELTLGG